ncbi:hypothetical protein SLH46_03810 [Draconibacterium sp. IB214405]|uniref:hypothetical protein n=1 Tax=Draconibacterium sp. IB214405 TaxID=3097352 RepID=UPI002A184B8B|nr:hypothetical protein [Draconibacterium sp. IB214405]MDX8338297.1 hypothetical protein [Draconibacterium sp. IB214405]
MSFQKLIGFSVLFFFFMLITVAKGFANIVILNGLTHENSAEAGESYRGGIQVQNSGTEPRSIKVYQKDYWYSFSGESRHDEAGTLARSNAAWIKSSPTLLTLQPDETAMIDFEVTVPGIDTLKGTYWSVIMVEGIEPQDTVASAGMKIHTAIRYAVQVITNIGNTGKRDLQFLGLELTPGENKTQVLNVAIENTGERILKPELNLEIFNADGESIGVFKAERRKTYPTTSILLKLPLEGVKPGEYAAVLIADCDEDNIFGTNITLEL